MIRHEPSPSGSSGVVLPRPCRVVPAEGAL